MKILLENYVLETVPVSLDSSPNYPPANLIHPFLYKRYQNVTGDDVITIDLKADRTINSFFVGYHNAVDSQLITEEADIFVTEDGDYIAISNSKLTLRLYDYTGALLYTNEFDLVEQFEAIYFANVLNVRTATITIDWGVGAGYLGGIGLGQAYIMPDPVADWSEEAVDNGVMQKSPGGQVSRDYVEPLMRRRFAFTNVPRESFLEIRAAVLAMGQGRPFWIDYFEDNHDAILPGYVELINGIQGDVREPLVNRHSFTLEFEECR